MRAAPLLLVAALAVAPTVARAQFSYRPVGELVSGSGTGRADDLIYAPDILFPIRDAPAYANSQVWGVGGSSGPSGSQCDTRNYAYPWHDNYCETRTWSMPLCPSGTGHQGQDVRGPTCMAGVNPVLAVVDGTITNVGSYSVYLTAADGTRYDYLHMFPVPVAVGDVMSRGDIVGYVNNHFGTSTTTIHMHFNIRQDVAGVGSVYVPPYTSLIHAYETLIGASVPTDAGTVVPPDAGTTPIDAGSTPIDAGAAPIDAGATPIDAGSTPIDAGSIAEDTTPPPMDAGAGDRIIRGGCSCRAVGDERAQWGALGPLLLAALIVRRRRG